MKLLVQTYIWLAYVYNKVFKKNLKGRGYIQKLLKHDCVLNFMGKKIYYKHDIEGSYDNLFIGKPNEPETHILFKHLVPCFEEIHFVDVGASIGEMVFGISIYENVKSIYAFEPRVECIEAMQKSLELNSEKRVKLFNNIVSDKEGAIDVFYNPGGSSSGVYDEGGSIKKQIHSVTLDSVLPAKLDNTIILVDVEGAEPMVLNSGREFIRNNSPLIIFEYNRVSKKHFNLNKIKHIIGNNYVLFRLRTDGALDQNFSRSWNVIAIPMNTQFEKVLL